LRGEKKKKKKKKERKKKKKKKKKKRNRLIQAADALERVSYKELRAFRAGVTCGALGGRWAAALCWGSRKIDPHPSEHYTESVEEGADQICQIRDKGEYAPAGPAHRRLLERGQRTTPWPTCRRAGGRTLCA